MTDSQTTARVRLPVVGASYVAVAMSFLNVATYLFTALVARRLVPSVFGEVTALMGILLVGSVAALGLQTTTARRLAVSPGGAARAEIVGVARTAGIQIGLGASAVLLLLSPVLVPVLSLADWLPSALVALTLLPLCLFGAQAGVAQGLGQWGRLSALYVASGVGRLVFGIGGALLIPSATGVLLGVFAGACLPVVLGWSVFRAGQPRADRGAAAHSLTTGQVRWETAHGTHALLALFAVTSADAVLARVVLGEHDSGLYAAGLIVAKAALFLPQFVAVVAFPVLARDRDAATRRIATLIVAAFGAVAALGTSLLPSLALTFAGGERYAGITDLLPLFAVEGATFALVNLLVYDSLADGSGRVARTLWCVLAGVILASLLFVDSILALTCAMTAGGLVVGATHLLLRGRSPGQRA